MRTDFKKKNNNKKKNNPQITALKEKECLDNLFAYVLPHFSNLNCNIMMDTEYLLSEYLIGFSVCLVSLKRQGCKINSKKCTRKSIGYER